MITRAHATAIAPSITRSTGFETAITNRRLTIGMGSRLFYIGLQSSHYRQSAKQPHQAGGGYESSALWRSMGYIGCASLALCVVIASGGVLRAAPLVSGYSVILSIGDKAALPAPHHKATPRRLVRVKPVAPRAPIAEVADEAGWSVDPAFESGDGSLALASSDADVATVTTANGERAVAVYGQPRRVGGKSCRDVSVFVRGPDGKVSVSPTVQCDAGR